jgi:hypothetical protein
MDKKVRVRFIWFFDNRSVHHINFFKDLFADRGFAMEVISDPNDICDIEFINVHKPRFSKLLGLLEKVVKNPIVGDEDSSLLYPNLYNPRTKNALNRAWFTMENVRPPAQSGLLVTLSYDQNDFGGLNLYLPAWYLQVGLFNPVKLDYVGVESNALSLTQPRSPVNTVNRKFACSIFRNAHSVRLLGISALNGIAPVDLFGPIAGSWIASKSEVAKNYKFTVCFENDLYPGYVTEKLHEAYITGTVPIYWGDLGNDSNINRKSFINMNDFESMDAFVNYVRSIDNDTYAEIYQQPFLNSIPDVSSIQDRLLKVL